MSIYLFYPYTDATTYNTLSKLAPGVPPNQPVPAVAPAAPAAIGAILRDGVFVSNLSGLVEADTLCIVGHGAPEMKVLGSNDPNLPKNDSHISQSKVIDRMTSVGFTANMMCKILIYSCYSAVGHRCLASLIAAELRNRNFGACAKVYGCLGLSYVKAKNGALTVKAKNEFYVEDWMPINWANLSQSPTMHINPNY